MNLAMTHELVVFSWNIYTVIYEVWMEGEWTSAKAVRHPSPAPTKLSVIYINSYCFKNEIRFGITKQNTSLVEQIELVNYLINLS
jgi:hypothetical protein